MSDNAHMRTALALADVAATLGEVPIGALVVRGDEVIAAAHNRREAWHDPTAHAEVIAIREASHKLGTWRLDGCTVYATLEPCAMCAGAMVVARIQRCVYGANDPKGGFLGTLGDLSQHPGLNHRFEVVSGVLADESRDRLQAFFRRLR